MDHEEIYTNLSLVASAEKLLSPDEQSTTDETSHLGESRNSHEEAAVGHKYRKSRRYLKLLTNIVLYAFALWGLFALISQGVQTTHRDGTHVKNIYDEHHHDHVATAEPEPEDEHHHQLSDSQTLLRSCSCGDSIAEAVTRGCKYDSLALAWLPPHCRDNELTAEFEIQGDGPNGTWIYWTDKEHTQEISIAEIAAKAEDDSFRFYMSYEWHVVHCLYYWLKEFRFRFNGKTIEPRDDNEDHIRHCEMVIRSQSPGTIGGVTLNSDVDD